ncbi:dTDP-4-amino-4,6-dideoxygalactose transaminase [Alcanivorax jadensis]|uniref:dTDP-4-amino-4,6-dideoxygalactose transaminase n=1 Tax=Alcanivorax jadensis TaxID=64988 RepID=UPI0024096F0B|nr:dTDP-4-amino-4,6-dideoxygalactose transaminase [Alcanivorax jadensis]MDF1637859.1 dTDP-4-amino-4,6-dideoxygalactose transaminase [Alcanivorax jadensis]
MNRPEDIVLFNQPYQTGKEQEYIQQALACGHTASAGPFTAQCENWLERHTGSHRVLLTHSCTNALEMAAVLLNIQPGDEVIMPSFTFTSTANAFVLRGATPVFVDIRADTLNIDETLIEQAITAKTRAIVPVHYAGAACEMDTIIAIAQKHNLAVVEDAAQCLGSTYKGQALGSIGHLGTYSFHASKNIQCGEGGALLINDEDLIERAEILHDKGTTRAQFRAGKIRQYSWVDLGMSAPPSELQAAFLLAQLEASQDINLRRRDHWKRYHDSLEGAEQTGMLKRPKPSPHGTHNAHIFALTFPSKQQRHEAAEHLKSHGIATAIHYEPLHLSKAGKKWGGASGALQNSKCLPQRLLRLPLWHDLPDSIPEAASRLITNLMTNH